MVSNKNAPSNDDRVNIDEVKLKLQKWREEKNKLKHDNIVPAPKRFRIGQTPPPLPKSVKKRNPIKSRIDCHWKKRLSTGSTSTSNKKHQNQVKNCIKENEPVKKPTVESRRLTAILKPNRNSTQTKANSDRSVLAVKPMVLNTNNDKKTSNKEKGSTTFNKNKTSVLKNKIQKNKSGIKPTTRRRHSLRSTRTLQNIQNSTPMSVTKRPQLTISDENDNILAWKIDSTPPNNVRFKTPGPSTPHTKTVLAQARKGKEASMRNTLKNWLDSNGRTPSQFRHLMCFDAVMSAKKVNAVPPTRSSITVAELTQQQEAMLNENDEDVFIVDKAIDQQDDQMDKQILSMLDECFTLFLGGFSADIILPWLDKIENFAPQVRQYTPFYICKLNVVKSTGSKQQVLDVIHDAILHSAKPADKLAQVVKSTLQELLSGSVSHQQVRHLEEITDDNAFDSTTIKYSLRQVTPFSSAIKRKRPTQNDMVSVRTVVTPVRRSARHSLSVFHSQDQVYTTLQDIPDTDRNKALFHQNLALEI